MPYVEVYVEVEDVLSDLSNKQLHDELDNRARKKVGGGVHSADFTIPLNTAKHTLVEAADILRKAGRVDLGFKLDEINHDFVRS